MSSDIYAFVFKGLLTEEALDKSGRLRHLSLSSQLDAELAKRLPIDEFDEELVAMAQKMAVVYVAIASFENSVREFVSKVLLESVGADWWTKAVSEKIRDKPKLSVRTKKRFDGTPPEETSPLTTPNSVT